MTGLDTPSDWMAFIAGLAWLVVIGFWLVDKVFSR